MVRPNSQSALEPPNASKPARDLPPVSKHVRYTLDTSFSSRFNVR